MLKAVGQALFSSGLQNPKYTEDKEKVNVLQRTSYTSRAVNLWPGVGGCVCHCAI